MNDFLRESFSYSKIFKEIRKIERKINPGSPSGNRKKEAVNGYFISGLTCDMMVNTY